MSLTTTPILKNNVATPDDSIYLAPVRLSCYLCKKNGRPKIFKNLWALYRHFQLVHAEEYQKEWKRLTGNLHELIKKGIIR